MTIIRLKERIKKLPTKPGIYLFKKSQNKTLYIGKALNLKNRLKNYLKTPDTRIQQMLAEANKLDYIETESDIEALILESQYIKRFRPDFNIVLKDDKQYSFVVFTDEKYPKIFTTHQPQNVSSIKYLVSGIKKNKKIQDTKYKIQNTKFIGPFTDAGALKTTLRLLRRIFPYCTCKQLHNNYCLNYHIGKCIGDCCLKKSDVSSIEYLVYKKNIRAMKEILSGKKSSLIKRFEREMENLSDKKEYEKALQLQNKIKKLKRVFENAQIIHNTRYIIQDTKTEEYSTNILKQLAKIVGMNLLPHRIEAYDIANIQGKFAVGAMVVFTDGIPDKNQYRKFKIYTKSTADDTGMLREILTRRFNHPEWLMPDMILVDGGVAQLNTAIDVLRIMNNELRIKVIALTKNENHIGTKIITDTKKEILLYKLPTEVKNLLLHLDSEAHRFAISYYRKLHGKSLR